MIAGVFIFSGMNVQAAKETVPAPAPAPKPAPVEATPPPESLPKIPNAFVTCALVDSSGSVWAGTETGGVFRLKSKSQAWECMNAYGFPEDLNVYAVAEDLQGRIWAGTGSHGVAVWNGKSWQTYDQENALLGERIYAISVSPVNGDVAIATSAGLTIYSSYTESWKDITRAEGLVEYQIASIAFTPTGTMWVAFACGGIASASPQDGYATWKTIQAPWYWDRHQYVRQSPYSTGDGLPSNFCNAIAAPDDYQLWVGTNAGLGYKVGKNNSLQYVRGMDYAAKNEGLMGGRAPITVLIGSQAKAPTAAVQLLSQDFVTCLYRIKSGC